jgi:hypothetical protein
MTQCIAERKLLYSFPKNSERKSFVIRIFAPFEIQEGTVDFNFDQGTAGCTYEIDGLPEKILDTTYGADSIQALQLAVNVEGILKQLSKKYDLYFPSGERYFDL